ncbi:YdiU family protein [Falsirhodobacter sp. alg1]|uniref:protein adenylyltransferase SelO n=1 Tax=Falsirhodobacter sp. alg1 TaxID=1472418 RepID=UPI0005F033AA|nr:YdiU family protein [Falsirhodobacter sp. alg1]
MTLPLHARFTDEMPGFYVDWQTTPVPAPATLKLNEGMCAQLGLPDLSARALIGLDLAPDAHPVALVYAGHQFGGFSPRLGDGRALLLGEINGPDGALLDVALKGSGPTPFSRGADGKAAIGPVLREYLISEAMHALGIPTTRALAAVGTGEMVMRDTGPVPGAVLVRIAASHIRVGTFQYFAARGELDKVQHLADYAIARHYPECAGNYPAFFAAVAKRQAQLVAQWMLVGFVHGVMNTDNMTISGETIDYGPCAFMEEYAPGTVFSSIDRQGRYAYANQPLILGWNLARFAETLLPLFNADESQAVEQATDMLQQVAADYQEAWLAGMREKLGLDGAEEGDQALADDFLALITGADWTICFRSLSAAIDDPSRLRVHLADDGPLEDWLMRWAARRGVDAAERMDRANPVYIPRNERVESALTAAIAGDMTEFEELLQAISAPYEARKGLERFAIQASAGFGQYRTFCGT